MEKCQLEALIFGLEQFYEDHWRKMCQDHQIALVTTISNLREELMDMRRKQSNSGMTIIHDIAEQYEVFGPNR